MAQSNGFFIPLVITLSGILGGLILFRFKMPLLTPAPPVQADSLGGTVPQAPPESPPDAVSASTLEMPPLARIKSGNNPLWLELGTDGAGPEGPLWIPSPAEASLKPFTPWPLAHFITGMALQDDRLILAVNREGFLIFLPEQGSMGLYRIADAPYWGNYTVDSLFVFDGTPAVLLYRNDFFVEPAAAPPDPQVLVPVKGSTRPMGRAVPAFGAFPPSDGWEVESLRQGQDGYWYYRGIQRSAAHVQSVYMRSSDLTLPGEGVSVAAFRNSALPEPLDHAPPVLRLVLDAVFDGNRRDRGYVAAIISPDFPYPRHFARDTSLADNREQVVALAGYYIHTATGPKALVILPDGRGMAGDSNALAAGKARAFSCPPLPTGFVYTGIGPSGDALIAAWEEQQGWNIGSAGLMILRRDDP
ncbi:MAG: hypothetical protein LBU25_08895 [Treponema sp.]|jgi:hypothetical protein|nr:hypothetical protein [Treponema sp.]